MRRWLPSPAKRAALGFALAEKRDGFTSSLTYRNENHPTLAVVTWPRAKEIRLCRLVAGLWVPDFTGPVADEAAFDALVKQHFPEVITQP